MTVAREPRLEPQARAKDSAAQLSVVLRGGSWQTLAQVAPLMINILLTPVIINGLGIARYGLFLLVNVIATMLAAADGGIGGAALRFFALYAGEEDATRTTRLLVTTFLMITGVGGVAFALFYGLAPAGLALLRIPDALLPEGAFFLRTLIMLTALAHLRNLFAAILNAHNRFALTSITMSVGYAIYAVGVLLTVARGWGLYGIAMTMVAQQVVATLLIVPAATRHLERRWTGFMSKAELKEFWRYALHAQWAELMLLLTLQTDAIVVGAFLPLRQVAYYGTGANFALQMYTVPNNAVIPMQSVLGQAVGANGPTAASADFERLQRLWVIGSTGWGVVATSAAWFGITAWLGPEFAISGVVAIVMLLAYQITLWASVLIVWTQVLGRPELNARSASIGALANVVLTVALVMPFGILGTVAATAMSQSLAALLLLRFARARLPGPTRSFLREVPVLPAFVTAGVVVGLEFFVHPHLPVGALGLVLTGLAAAPGLVVYALMAFGPRMVWRFVRGHVRRRP